MQSELAGLEAADRERARQAEKHQREAEELQRQRQELASRQGELRHNLQTLEAGDDPAPLERAERHCREAEAAVELSRRRLGEVAGRSGSWLEAQQRSAAASGRACRSASAPWRPKGSSWRNGCARARPAWRNWTLKFWRKTPSMATPSGG